MHRIDGSHGEGGGQILRTALALSAVAGEPVRLVDVRASRERPGLAAQHLAAVRLLAEMCEAEVDGDDLGSTEVVFEPGEVRPGRYEVGVGTAGSVTLIAGAAVLAATAAEGRVTLELSGGTDVKWSPTFDYLENVTLPLLQRAGVDVKARLVRRGHYPRGGGRIEVSVEPSELRRFDLSERGELRRVSGRAHVSNLPVHIAEREAGSARETLESGGVEAPVEIEETEDDAVSTGTSITLWAEYDGTVLGASALGERGVPAEEVGELAAERLLREIESDGTVDRHAADQMVPYVALGGGEYVASEVTSHLETNVWLCNRLLGERVRLDDRAVEHRSDG